MSRKNFLENIGWEEHLRPFLYKKLPPGTGWAATLGSLCALLFGMMAVSGLFLAMYYNPSPDKAYQSVDFIMTSVSLGAVLRGIHHWGAGAMVLAVFIHLLSNYFSGSFKAPRQLTWMIGVCLFLVTLGLGFTGYLLPWDMKAYWATVVSTNIPRDIPLIGPYITRIARGGETVSGMTLTRFYAVHMLLLPALLVMFTAVHIYLVRLHGVAEPAEAEEKVKSTRLYRFFPEHTFRSALVFAAVFAGILGLAIFRGVAREAIAGTLSDSYLPRPEWYYMWLFQLLTYFSGKWEMVGSLAIPGIGVALLFAIPFLSKTNLTGLAKRPLAMAAGVTGVIGIVYLSLMGFEGAKPYGQKFIVPDRPLTQVETRGLYLFADRDCEYCHNVDGRNGHRIGPDLANLVAKHRSREYIASYIKNPQAVSATSVMPKYDLPQADLDALAQFTLALDFSKQAPKTITRAEVMKNSVLAQVQAASHPAEAGK